MSRCAQKGRLLNRDKSRLLTSDFAKEEEEIFFAGREQVDLYDRAILTNRWLWTLALFSFFVIVALISGYISLRDEVNTKISLPPYGDFKVYRDKADDTYFRVWGEYLIREGSEFDPDTISKTIKKSTALMKHSTFLQHKPKFDAFSVSVITNQVRQKFEPYRGPNDSGVERVKASSVRGESAQKEVYRFWSRGKARQRIGLGPEYTRECEYWTFLYLENFAIYQDGFGTNCFDGPNVELSKELKSELKPINAESISVSDRTIFVEENSKLEENR